MAEIKYQYAYDENGVLVNINTLSIDAKSHEFRCIGCGGILTPRAIGSKYCRAHFYHKTLVECNGETYLHKLAKLYIKKKFDNSDEFRVSYPAEVKCNEVNCRLRNPNCCKKSFENNEVFDLKKYYDTCTEEQNVGPYVADLLLTNSKNEKLAPTLIEICVSHPCEKDKRNSGLKIIEIKIKRESDIEKLFENNVIKEEYVYSNKDKNVEFISFKRSLSRKIEERIFRYVVNKFTSDGYFVQISCSKANNKIRKDSQLELNVVCKNRMDYIPEEAVHLWINRNKGIRRCNWCKFYNQTIYEDKPSCKYNNKNGKNPYPKMKDAESCRVFSVQKISMNDYFFEEVRLSDWKSKPEYKVIIAGSSNVCKSYDYFKEQCLKYLKNKLETHEVILVSGTAKDIEYMTQDFAHEYKLHIQPHKADWDNDENAPFLSNKEMVDYSDALIIFWNGNSRYMQHLITLAKEKGIKIAEIKFN